MRIFSNAINSSIDDRRKRRHRRFDVEECSKVSLLHRQTNRRMRINSNAINSNIDDRRKRRHRRFDVEECSKVSLLHRQTNRRMRIYSNVINSNIDDRRKRRRLHSAPRQNRPANSTSNRTELCSVTNCRLSEESESVQLQRFYS